MSQQPSHPAGPSGDDWPDYLWPGEDDAPGDGRTAEHGAPGSAWPRPPADGPFPAGPFPGGPPPGGRRRGFRPGVLAAVVLVAALTGAGAAVAAQLLSHPPATPAGAGNRPSVLSPAQPGGQIGNGQPGTQIGGNGVPGGAPGGAGQIFMVGRVTAVTGDSITIGGPGHTVTASITSATKFTGKAASIAGIKAGDQVSAQITQQGGRYVVVALQYPAQLPAGVPGG